MPVYSGTALYSCPLKSLLYQSKGYEDNFQGRKGQDTGLQQDSIRVKTAFGFGIPA